MTERFFREVYPRFERLITLVMAVLLMVAITYAVVMFTIVLLKTVMDVQPIVSFFSEGQKIAEPIGRLQAGLYHVFGGFLLVLLGIELIGTVKSFAENSSIKMEAILAIAIIATSRHLITLDYHHSDPLTIFAAGFVVICLVGGYFLVKLKVVTDRPATSENQ